MVVNYSTHFNEHGSHQLHQIMQQEEHDIKLKALREKLQAGEDSSVIKDFDGEKLIAKLHRKHTK